MSITVRKDLPESLVLKKVTQGTFSLGEQEEIASVHFASGEAQRLQDVIAPNAEMFPPYNVAEAAVVRDSDGTIIPEPMKGTLSNFDCAMVHKKTGLPIELYEFKWSENDAYHSITRDHHFHSQVLRALATGLRPSQMWIVLVHPLGQQYTYTFPSDPEELQRRKVVASFFDKVMVRFGFNVVVLPNRVSFLLWLNNRYQRVNRVEDYKSSNDLDPKYVQVDPKLKAYWSEIYRYWTERLNSPEDAVNKDLLFEALGDFGETWKDGLPVGFSLPSAVQRKKISEAACYLDVIEMEKYENLKTPEMKLAAMLKQAIRGLGSIHAQHIGHVFGHFDMMLAMWESLPGENTRRDALSLTNEFKGGDGRRGIGKELSKRIYEDLVSEDQRAQWRARDAAEYSSYVDAKGDIAKRTKAAKELVNGAVAKCLDMKHLRELRKQRYEAASQRRWTNLEPSRAAPEARSRKRKSHDPPQTAVVSDSSEASDVPAREVKKTRTDADRRTEKNNKVKLWLQNRTESTMSDLGQCSQMTHDTIEDSTASSLLA